MSVDTYYNVLGISEAATQAEIKAAYRNLIKQVHPDTLATLSPYLRRIAEDKTKEMTEAYSVLSNSAKRREYDSQLTEYRGQSTPPTTPPSTPPPPQAAPQASPGPYCNRCGTSLYGSGFCPTCNKFTPPAATPPQPKVVRALGYNWAPLMRWGREHPLLILVSIFGVWLIAVAGNETAPRVDTSCPASQKVEINGNFVCPSPAGNSPASTNKPVSPVDSVPPSIPAGFTVEESDVSTTGGGHTIAGTYIGTVHNQTVGLTSSFAALLYQKAGVLDGCMDVKPPLYGSGPLHGSIRGSHVHFVVADIRFQGVSLKNEITGSYVVSRQDGQQLGDFRLTKQPAGAEAQYGCANGKLAEVGPEAKTATIDFQPEHAEKPHPTPVAVYAIVGPYYTSLYKRCAFLPKDNYGRCNYRPQTVAQLKNGDRVRVLSSQVRAEDGDDIYKVRTQQGWEGWIDSRGITIEP